MAVHGNVFDASNEIYAETIEVFKHIYIHPVYGYPFEERSFVQWPKSQMEFE